MAIALIFLGMIFVGASIFLVIATLLNKSYATNWKISAVYPWIKNATVQTSNVQTTVKKSLKIAIQSVTISAWLIDLPAQINAKWIIKTYAKHLV